MFEHPLILACTFIAITSGVCAMIAACDFYGVRVRARVDALQKSNLADAAHSSGESAAANKFLPRMSEQILQLIPYRRSNQVRIQQRLSNAGIYDLSATSIYFAAKLLLMTLPAVATLI